MTLLVRRVTFYLFAAAIAVVLNFFLPRLMAGDPLDVMLASYHGQLTTESTEALKQAFGLVDAPLHIQFSTYLGNLFRGNLGLSVSLYPTPVSDVIRSALGWTLRMVGIATVLSFTIGIALGTVAAWRRGGFVDSAILPIASVFMAFPYFWVALIALYILGFKWSWFPIGRAEPMGVAADWGSLEYTGSVLYHMALPVITIVITSAGRWMLGMRNNMIGELSSDYITMAKAKGLSNRRIMFAYAGRNAILPSLTGFALSLGFVVSGALLTEIVFSYPGMGLVLLTAVRSRDYPLLQGILLMLTFTVLLANFVVDLMYVFLDPRIRVESVSRASGRTA